jgi:hypothetical protein
MLQDFERKEWGTNDWQEIQVTIRERDWQERQDALTGMAEEQADWDSDEVE